MRVCAVDLKANEANIVLLDSDNGLFSVPECRAKKITVAKPEAQESIQHFHRTMSKLVEDYQVEKIVIRERPTKGKFAGSSAGFKLEAALQLIEGTDAEVLPSSVMKQTLKRHPVDVSLKELGLKQFQEQAFLTACAYCNQHTN
ncbi:MULTISPECIES: DUF3010 family protein [Salinivibrio]|uniref:DUF3010 family protein n=2 Tax=Salinivibrio TaxID=51366 RepID=A0ABY7LK90_9GAMM|nr:MULTISPECIES: DUF3010 family protein [Salinivibrio]OOF11791.1 hypothetical protein BZG83_12085 [Salinivibrio sp. PR919]OOF16719.1 hypothetical protein BZG84_09870 [Salinivibrio sp. PR932]OOF22917.1 hypothetical protein BZJ17_05205 [Salinivibrio sp. IB574]OOF31256.1 hypothetical protein BZJ20_06890 [Salinivibrio proteolyticus]QIR07434.1 DUF3010 family protein [Salinivibrio costicola]